jgi:hypothetical protein
MTQHPVTPPPSELVLQWIGEFFGCTAGGELSDSERFLTTRAAQWGADQELEACCEWIPKATPWDAEQLRAARRPKPPSLKEQALMHFQSFAATFETSGGDSDLIRRALEQLPDYTNEEL